MTLQHKAYRREPALRSTLPGGLDDRLHVVQIPLERPPAGEVSWYSVLGIRPSKYFAQVM